MIKGKQNKGFKIIKRILAGMGVSFGVFVAIGFIFIEPSIQKEEERKIKQIEVGIAQEETRASNYERMKNEIINSDHTESGKKYYLDILENVKISKPHLWTHKDISEAIFEEVGDDLYKELEKVLN